MRQLIPEDRRDADRHGSGHALVLEAAQRLDQRQVRVERGFRQPDAAVRPAPMVEHPGKVTMQCENEVHRSSSSF